MSSARAEPGGIDAVVIGGSAGALAALKVILARLPRDLAVPLLVVVHLPADRASNLAAFFAHAVGEATHTIEEAEDKAPIAPGAVYVAPPGYHLLVEADRHLALSVDAPVYFSRPSIDVLFESAARAYGPRLLGVILSGASPDGADGLAAVGNAGGLTIVQDPGSAVAPMMPAAAIEAWPRAQVMAPPDIAARLAALGRGRRTPGEPSRGPHD